LIDNEQKLRPDPAEAYHRNGFAVLRAFDEKQVHVLEQFSKDWLYTLLEEWTKNRRADFPLEYYHLWSKEFRLDHARIFRAENRHTNPGLKIKDLLLNPLVRNFLEEIGVDRYEIWNQGLGWLGFRFLRPGAGDGYSFSRKAWGPAKEVVSCWIPIIGHDPEHTLTILPGSHRREYEKYLPTQGKFAKDEYRLKERPPESECYHPGLERGEVIWYHPGTIHSEDIPRGSHTRLSLEFRIHPLQFSIRSTRRDKPALSHPGGPDGA